MKLNKRETQAFNTLENILHALKYSYENEIIITTSDYNAVKEVFNIDLKKITYTKKSVEEFKRNKANIHLSFLPPFDRNRLYQFEIFAYPFGYFPFQIKKLKEK